MWPFDRFGTLYSMHADTLVRRQWDAQEALVKLIYELEQQARYGAAARCRAVLSRMQSGDLAGALGSSGTVSDAAGSCGASRILAALTSTLMNETIEEQLDE